MSYYYLSVMSSRVFHSRDLDGLQEALTDENEPGPRTTPHRRHTQGDRCSPAVRLAPRTQTGATGA